MKQSRLHAVLNFFSKAPSESVGSISLVSKSYKSGVTYFVFISTTEDLDQKSLDFFLEH